MNLEEQVKILIQEAPQYGVPTEVMKNGVTPVLKQFAQELKYLEYFIGQNPQKGWIITTLSHRNQPNEQKKVIYAFSTLEDALEFQGSSQSEIIPIAIPVTHLIFQLLALKPVDSLIFMDTPGNLIKGTEITKANLLDLLQLKLQQNRNIPPNLA